MGSKIKGGTKFMMKSRTNINAPMHHKGGKRRILWHTFGPSQWMKKGKAFEKKVESKKFVGIDYRFYDDLAKGNNNNGSSVGKKIDSKASLDTVIEKKNNNGSSVGKKI